MINFKPTVVLSLKVGAAALVVGLVLGGLLAREWYQPKLELAESRVDQLSGALETQNKAVSELEAKTSEMTKRLRTAQAEAKKRRNTAEGKAMTIMSAEPPAGVDQCTAASNLIRQQLGSKK